MEKLPPIPPLRIMTNGINMAYHDLGDGPAVILLHGFPGLAYDWCRQGPAIAAAGWRVIVPELRGYGATGPAGELSSYSLRNLSADVLGLMDGLGIANAVVIGHDFGGSLTWELARDHAGRVRGAASLNTPFSARLPTDVATLMAKMRGPNTYMAVFQTPGVAEAILESDLEETFAGMLRKCALSLEEFQADPVLRSVPVTVYGREPSMMGAPIDPEDVAVYVEAYCDHGFTAPINWYRNLRQNWLDSEGAEDRIDVPSLMVVTDNDFFLPPETSHGMADLIPDLEFAYIEDCGHWTQREQPERTNTILIDWLDHRMRQPGSIGNS